MDLPLSLNSSGIDYWKDNRLFQKVLNHGYSQMDWEKTSDEFLLYLFLHDEPTLGKIRSEKTKKAYFRDLSDFLSFAKEYKGVKNLHPDDLKKYQYIMEETGYAPTTLRRKTAVIKQFMRYLLQIGAINQDNTFLMKRTSINKDQLVNRDLYEHEVRQLLNYFKTNDYFAYTLLFILVSTGLRISELASARWADLFYYPEQDRFFITVTGKRNKERIAVIFKDVLRVIQEFRKRRGHESELSEDNPTAFFPKADGSHYNSAYLSHEFSRLILNTHEIFPFIKRRKILHEQGNKRYNITPHTCRHYTAAYFAEQGVNLKAIQDMLGHESITTTESYLRRKRRLEEHAGVQVDNLFLNLLLN